MLACVLSLEAFPAHLPEASKFHFFHSNRGNGFCMKAVSEMFHNSCTISLKPLLPVREISREAGKTSRLSSSGIIACMSDTRWYFPSVSYLTPSLSGKHWWRSIKISSYLLELYLFPDLPVMLYWYASPHLTF